MKESACATTEAGPYAQWKNPENPTDHQQAKLAWVAKVNHQLFRAYLLKEQLRAVFALKGQQGKQLLDRWLSWARRCRIPAFVGLAQRISKHRVAIDATLEHRLSNGLVESTNTKIRLATRTQQHPYEKEHAMTENPTSQQTPEQQAVSRRQALTVGGGLIAAAAVGSVASAGPAAAAGSDARPQTLLSISLGQAQAVLKAAEQEAGRLRVPSFIVVVDVCGDVKASSRQDGNSRASLTLAPLKAQTALAFRTATATLAQRTTDPVRAQSLLAAGFTLLGGGLPLTADGQIIGAVGVGGGSPDQDIQVAEAGLAALRR